MFDINGIMREEAEKAIADEVVAQRRIEGVTSVEDVTINLDTNTQSIGVSVDRVKRLVSRNIG